MELFRRRFAAPLIAAAAAVLAVLLAFAVPRLAGVPILQALEATTYDLRLHVERRVRPVPVTSDIVIIGIDDQSLATYGRWPWPREVWADVIDALVDLGIKAVFLDISFPDPATSTVRTRQGTRALADALGDAVAMARAAIQGSGAASALTTGAGAAALDAGFAQLKNQVAGFLPAADEVVAESLELARRRGIVSGGVVTVVHGGDPEDPAARAWLPTGPAPQALALFADDASPDLNAEGVPAGVRAYARAHLNELREHVVRERTRRALGDRPVADVDARALFAAAVPPSYRDAGTLGLTIFEQELSARLLAGRHLLTVGQLENGAGIPDARTLLLPTFTIARRLSTVGVDTELKDIDGKYRAVPALWRRPEGMLPTAGLALYLELAADRSGKRPELRLEPGPVLAIERRGPGGQAVPGAAPLRVPLSPRGEMLVHWAGRFDDTFPLLPAGALLEYAAKKRDRELWFASQSTGTAYRDVLVYRDAARSIWARDPQARPSLAELTRRVAAREPGYALDPKVLAPAGPSAPVTAGEPRPIAAWVELFDALRGSLETAIADRNRAMLEMVEKIPDPARRAERRKKYARLLAPYEANVRRTEALARDLRGRLAGRVCFIGHVASSSTDLASTPFQRAYPKVGSHANVLNTLRQERFLYRPAALAWSLGGLLDGFLQLPLLVLACVALALVIAEVSSAQGFLIATAFGLLWMLATTALLIGGGIWLDVVAPILGATITYLAVVTARNRRTEKIRSMFESYVDPHIVQVVVDDENLWTELGGREAQITAYFSDIAGFTTLSELLSAHEVSEMLTDYLSPMTDIILAHEGTRDKYIGDAIVAFFGAPIPIDGHELKACLAAIEQQERLIELKKKWQADGRDWYRKVLASGTDLSFRVGLNSGHAKVGNFGSTRSKNYTMIGDTVNLASRLEGANKEYGTLIMASKVTVAAHRDKLVTRELDRLVVKGKLEAVSVHEVIGRAGAVPGLWDRVLDLYNTGLDFYHRRDFTKARDVFQKLLVLKPQDGPAAVYAARAQAYIECPPQPDWDGAHRMTHK